MLLRVISWFVLLKTDLDRDFKSGFNNPTCVLILTSLRFFLIRSLSWLPLSRRALLSVDSLHCLSIQCWYAVRLARWLLFTVMRKGVRYGRHCCSRRRFAQWARR
jgi:hypothetical protein